VSGVRVVLGRRSRRAVDARRHRFAGDIALRMNAADVLLLLSALDDESVHYWLDGGWGVDCLLGEETRKHSDLDFVVARHNLVSAQALLESRGFKVIRDWLPTAIAWRDQHGREVDLHLVDTTADGGGDQVLLDGTTWHYASPVSGSIKGETTTCASPEDPLLMHQDYEPRPVDFHDVRRIAERLGLPLPVGFDAQERK
jgi:lincosamide nucleotidyltransferase A/C/D/E